MVSFQRPFRSRVILYLVCLLTIAVATLAATGQAFALPATGGDYGNIAYSPSLQESFFAFANTKVSAEIKAWKSCAQAEGSKNQYDCNSAVWVHNGWLSIAVDPKGSWGTGWGPIQADAERWAMQVCKNNGGTNCQIKGTDKTNNPQASAEGGTGFGTAFCANYEVSNVQWASAFPTTAHVDEQLCMDGANIWLGTSGPQCRVDTISGVNLRDITYCGVDNDGGDHVEPGINYDVTFQIGGGTDACYMRYDVNSGGSITKKWGSCDH